jgi:hypothetical protein
MQELPYCSKKPFYDTIVQFYVTLEIEVLPSHKQTILLFNSQHVSSRISQHQVILRDAQLVTDQ